MVKREVKTFKWPTCKIFCRIWAFRQQAAAHPVCLTLIDSLRGLIQLRQGTSNTTSGTSASTAPNASSAPNPTTVQATSQGGDRVSTGDAEEEEMLRRAIEESMKDDNAENANEGNDDGKHDGMDAS